VHHTHYIGYNLLASMVRWPSGLRRQTKDLVRKGVGSNPTLIIFFACLLIFNLLNL
jgi:hypothetical protein